MYIRNLIIGGASFCLSFSAVYANDITHRDVTHWAELDSEHNLILTNDVHATGMPKIITYDRADSQIIDGNKHALHGSSGYGITLAGAQNFVVQDFGSTQKRRNSVGQIIGAVSNFDSSVFYVTQNTNLTLINSIFSDNTDGRFGTGAVIHLQSGSVTIDSSKFHNNISDDGGAVYITGSSHETSILSAVVNSEFYGNKAESGSGGAINGGFYVEYIADSLFQNNESLIGGGAIANMSAYVQSLPTLIENSHFIGNKTDGYGGSMMWSFHGSTTDGFQNPFEELDFTYLAVQNSTFENNSADIGGGAGYLYGEGGPVYILDSTFKNNSSTLGGGLFLLSHYREGDPAHFYLVDTSFYDNTAETQGGAIYVQNAPLMITALNSDVVFSNNTAGADNKNNNAGGAIYFQSDDNDDILSLNASDGKAIIFNDSIGTENHGTPNELVINATNLSYFDIKENGALLGHGGTVIFNAPVGDRDNYFNISLYDGTLALGQNEKLNATADNPDGYIDGNNLTAYNATLTTVNDQIGSVNLKMLTLREQLNYTADVNLQEALMDRITAQEINGEGTLHVSDLNLTHDSSEQTVVVAFAEDNLKNQVTTSVTQAMAPIYIWDVNYNADDGTFVFSRHNTIVDNENSDSPDVSDTPDSFNPYVYGQNLSVRYVADVQKTINNFLLHDFKPQNANIKTEEPKEQNLWVQMVHTDDKTDYKLAEKVKTKTSILFGGYTAKPTRVLSSQLTTRLYAGAITGEQKYKNLKAKHNGGMIGATADLTNGGWQYGANITGAFLRTHSKNPYGKDRYTTKWFGVGSKAGYTFDLTPSWYLTPSASLGWTIANTEDFTSVSGVRFKTDTMTFVDFVPDLTLSRTFDGWEGFAKVRYLITSINGQRSTADQITLPLHNDGKGFEYGIGARKTSGKWRFDTAVYRRDGDREGWNIWLGTSYAF